MAKVLLPVGDAAEVMDTLYAYYRLKEGGYEVVVAGPEARQYQMVLHEIPPGWDITRETAGYHIQATLAFRDIDPVQFVGAFLTGGRAPEYIRYDQHLMATLKSFFEVGKPVCSVCHGAELVAAADVIRDRRIATVPKCQIDVEAVGASFVNEGLVRDGNLVSGRTWHDQHLYMPVFVAMLDEFCGVSKTAPPVAQALGGASKSKKK
ncbi:MAG: peptidase [Acidobacteria bacterium]|nr:peptidase [Acidobacteriota bacterium]